MNMNMFRYYSLAVAFLMVAVLTGCKDEKGNDSVIDDSLTNKDTNEWIYGIMDENYLWYKDLPAKSSLNFDQDPKAFFEGLRSDKDGVKWGDGHLYFSSIEKKPEATKAISETEPTYGFEYIAYNAGKYYYARVLYVLPDSPAEEAGLRRDDWIVGINGSDDNITDYTVLEGGGQLEVKTAKIDYVNNFLADKGSLTLPAAKIMANNPLFKDSVYVYGDRKIGYLVYNHFTDEPEGADNNAYDTQLRLLFSEFKAKGVNEFVLDLRFNGGGLVSCAQLLSSLLAPADALGKTFCTLSYNDKKRNRNYKYPFDSSVSASNLNLKRLYVLTGQFTASASEAVINCLMPYMDEVCIIGDQTIGKAVGSNPYGEDERYGWILHPITLEIVNSEGKAEYGQVGFTPGDEKWGGVYIYEYELKEKPDPLGIELLPLGDTNEILLSTAIGIITGNSSGRLRSDVQTYSSPLKPVGSSLDRKAKGLIVPE